ncbi:MAG: metal-dependent transcriptional regulator [Christensenellales bacterium]|jgi:DtxR family Mn-dependent transcriptional regulator
MQEHKLTFSMENYLEAVYELSRGESGARVTDIAQRMDVTKASANNAMSVLSDKGLIINEKYQEIYLTPEGLKHARAVSQKHTIIESYFINVLDITPETANTDACAIEHVISHESVYAMLQHLSKLGFKHEFDV